MNETTLPNFTTVDDVVNHLLDLEPGFSALSHDALQDIVRDNRTNRYEEITQAEVDQMYEAAMAAVDAE